MQNFNSWIMYMHLGHYLTCIFCICSCSNWFIRHHKKWSFPAYLTFSDIRNFMALSKLDIFSNFSKQKFPKFAVLCCFKQNITLFLMTCVQLYVPPWLYWTRIQSISLDRRVHRAICNYLVSLPFLLSSCPNILDYNSLKVRPFCCSLNLLNDADKIIFPRMPFWVPLLY